MTAAASKPIRNLMLIDDNEIDQMVYKRIIERSGLVENTLSYMAGDLALDFIMSGECPPLDAIILDVNMPRMDGFEFLEALQDTQYAPLVACVIVMLTTSLDPKDKARAATSPLVKDFLYKPLIEEHLSTIVTHIAGRNSTQD